MTMAGRCSNFENISWACGWKGSRCDEACLYCPGTFHALGFVAFAILD